MECDKCGKKDFCSRLWRLYHIKNGLCGIKDISIVSKNLFRVCPNCNKDDFRSAKGFAGHIKEDVCLRREERAKKRKEMIYYCKHCEFGSSYKQVVEKHMESETCVRKLCKYCGKNDKWHEYRCNNNYIGEIVCVSHGDLAKRCGCKDAIRDLIIRKWEIDEEFARFDVWEKHPWEDRNYWENDCKVCGEQRCSDGHIWNCIANGMADDVMPWKDYVKIVRKKDPMRDILLREQILKDKEVEEELIREMQKREDAERKRLERAEKS